MDSRWLRYLTFGSLVIILIGLVVGALVAQFCGLSVATHYVFCSKWMIALWVLAVACGVPYMWRKKKHREIHWTTFCLHMSLPVIFVGALATHFLGRNGQVHLRLDSKPSGMFILSDGEPEEFPFLVQLKDFHVDYYAGTTTPKDFVSYLCILDNPWKDEGHWGNKLSLDDLPEVILKQGTVRMNHMLSYDGWQFCQSSADEDGLGCTLLVQHNPLGLPITYAGFALFIISMICYWAVPHHFKRRSQHLRHYMKSLAVLFFLGVSAFSSSASAANVAVSAMPIVQQMLNPVACILPLALLLLLPGLVFFVLYCLKRGQGQHAPHWQLFTMIGGLAVAWIYLSVMLGLRWADCGHAPLTDGSEVLQLLAWVLLPVCCIFGYRNRAVLPAGFLLSGLCLLVSVMPGLHPDAMLLNPALRSPMLYVHVLTIIISYALFGLVLTNSIVALFLPLNDQRGMMHQGRKILRPAVSLLAVGILLGAVWANMAWGRFWGWDPKETWALITLLVYAAPLHKSGFSRFSNPRFFHIYCIAAFLAILITSFGVDYLIGGLHLFM